MRISSAPVLQLFVAMLIYAAIPSCSYEISEAAQRRYSRTDRTLTSMEASDGTRMQVPKGIFHFGDGESALEANMKLPDLENMNPLTIATEVIDTAAEAGSKRQSVTGLHIPLPFGLSPLNLQLTQDRGGGIGFSPGAVTVQDGPAPLHGELRRSPHDSRRARKEPSDVAAGKNAAHTALEQARKACLGVDQKACDKALDRYHSLRVGSVKEQRRSPQKAEPKDLTGFVQTGLAKWLVPGLEQRLNQMTNEPHQTTTNVRKLEPTKIEPTPSSAELKRSPTKLIRRNQLILPARSDTGGRRNKLRSITLPPRNRLY